MQRIVTKSNYRAKFKNSPQIFSPVNNVYEYSQHHMKLHASAVSKLINCCLWRAYATSIHISAWLVLGPVAVQYAKHD